MGSPISASEGRVHRLLAESPAASEPASQSIVLTDTQLLRRANAELELLYAVEQLIAASSDLTTLIAAVLGHLTANLRCEAAGLLLVGAGDGSIWSMLRGQLLQQRTLARPAALAWLEQVRVRASRVVEVNDDVSANLLIDWPEVQPLKVYTAPLSGGGDQFGVLQLIAPQEMSEADELALRQLGLVAAQLGRAIAIKREQERLLRAARMSQLGEALEAMSDELHSPLLALSGYVEIMASADAQEVRREYAERIGRGLEHVERIVRETLSFARGQREVHVSAQGLPRFLEETRELLAPELRRSGTSLEVRCEYAGSVRFDAGKIQRVLWSLTRWLGQSGAKHVVWRGERAGEHLVFECESNGGDIAGNGIERLMGASLEDDVPSGDMLGLTMVRKILDAHRGRIHVKSEPGHGTVLRIELPF
jgi:signal transduction histidine kinase